mmetsp:Transcript_36316/g.67108  ORF Transcript_36316/g.67108 Transcript_36316/m.67108 type:complete len:419 (-) Transcript_36316:348-1604(-)
MEQPDNNVVGAKVRGGDGTEPGESKTEKDETGDPSDAELKGSSNPVESEPTIPVQISNPTKKSEGYGRSYIAYTVTSIHEGKKVDVFRRYSDFVWLRQALEKKFPGCIVPPLPEKAVIGRFQGEFVSQRMRGLERFTTRIMKHDRMKKDPTVLKFLCEQQLPKRNTTKSGTQAKKAFSMLSGLGSAMLNPFASEPSERAETKDDKACEEIEADAQRLHKVLGSLHGASFDLSKSEKNVTKMWLEMGKCLTELGRCEVDASEENFGGILAQIGKCCDRMSVCSAQCVDHSLLHLVEPLKDYVLLVEAVSTMMSNRKKALEDLRIALKDQSKKKAALRKQGGNAAMAKKAEEESTKLVEQRQNTLDTMTKSIVKEVAHFRREKKEDFKRMFEAFVKMRIEQAKRQQEAWESVLGDMQLQA